MGWWLTTQQCIREWISEVTEPPCEVVTEGVSDSAGEVTSAEEVEQALGTGDNVASVLGEVAGEPLEGSADPENLHYLPSILFHP